VFINDICDAIVHSKYLLFADDIRIYQIIWIIIMLNNISKTEFPNGPHDLCLTFPEQLLT
jgi:hypothetical protein